MTRTNHFYAVAAIALGLTMTACSRNSDSLTGPAAGAADPGSLNSMSTSSSLTLMANAVSESMITLLWSQIDGAASYEVLYMAESGFAWQRQAADGPSADLEGLEGCTKYYLRVRALNADGFGFAISDVDSATTDGCEAPAPPDAPTELLASVNENDRISVIFRDNADNEEAFEIQYLDLTAYDFRWHKVSVPAQAGSGDLVTAEIEGLQAGHTIYVRVCASNSAGSSGFSNVSRGATVEEEEEDRDAA